MDLFLSRSDESLYLLLLHDNNNNNKDNNNNNKDNNNNNNNNNNTCSCKWIKKTPGKRSSPLGFLFENKNTLFRTLSLYTRFIFLK